VQQLQHKKAYGRNIGCSMVVEQFTNLTLTSCPGGRHNMSRPLQVDLWPFDLESGVRVTCDVGYLCANFSLPRPLCSRLRPDVRDRQIDRRQTDVRHHFLMPRLGAGH